MKILLGSYEGSLVGWTVVFSISSSEAGSHKIRVEKSLLFSCPTHTSQINCCASSWGGKWAASGGIDEKIAIYDLKQQLLANEVRHEEGSVTCLQFFRDSHLISGNTNHTVIIWNTADWTQSKILGGHKASVLDLCIHPTGRLALSASQDRTIRLWNLIDGRCSYITRTKGTPSSISWSNDGTAFQVSVTGEKNFVEFHDLNSNLISTIPHTSRITSSCLLCRDCLISVDFDENLSFHSTEDGLLMKQVSLSTNDDSIGKFKHVALAHAPIEGLDYCIDVVVAVSSDGLVKVWNVMEMLQADGMIEPLCVLDEIRPRYTCVDVIV